MPLEISRNDIRNIEADAIVNPTDNFLSGAGSTDKLIHELGGPKLEVELKQYGNIRSGQAVITGSYGLDNCRYIIHTCGPVYHDGNHQEEELLRSCYRECLRLAEEKELTSIAFPLISSGTFAFPKGMALKIATDTITAYLLDHEMMVYLLVYDKESFDTARKLYTNIHDYLEANLEEETMDYAVGSSKIENHIIPELSFFKSESAVAYEPEYEAAMVFEPDESFSECLIRMIDEREMSDPEVYKKANIDRKHFNHIKNDKHYRPRKETAVALAIGMKLDMKDTDTLLERAGFVLSRSSKFDLIIRYCIENKIYDIFEINEILFEQDQKTLGC